MKDEGGRVSSYGSPVTSHESPVTSHALVVTATRAFALALVMAGALALGGCDYLPFGYTPIKEITTAPARFEGKEVSIKGKVQGTMKVMDFKAYTLRDDTGEISVVTAGELPARGESVAIKGTVKSALIVGGSGIGLRVEETQRLR